MSETNRSSGWPAEWLAVRAAALRDGADALDALDPIEAALSGQHAWADAAAVLHGMADEVAPQSASAPTAPAGIGVSATPSRTDLRYRIRRAICEAEGFMWNEELLEPDEYGEVADAVLAVLPPPADRAAVLREAADALDAGMERFFTEWPDEPRNSPYVLGKKDAADELRRLADEAPQPEQPVHGESVAHLAGLHGRHDQWADDERADFVPPAAEGLPSGALDSARNGATMLDAWAEDPHGRNFLAHALVQLARDGWLRTEPADGFEPVRERDDVPEPQDPATLAAATAWQDGAPS